MPTIRERRKADGTAVFHAQVRMTGFPARTASFRSRVTAKKWATTVEAEMIEGKHFRSGEARRRTVKEAVDRYLKEEVPNKRDGNMHRSYLPWWSNRIGTIKLAAVTPHLLVECRGELLSGTYSRATPGSKRSKVSGKAKQYTRCPSTVKKYLACLSHVFTVARREWHWGLNYNPVSDVSKPKGSGNRDRILSDDERKALLAETAKDATLHAFVMLALSTACRAGDLLRLEWADVDSKEGRLLFRRTKNDTPRSAWVSGEPLELLKAHGKIRNIHGGRVFAGTGGGGRYDYAKSFKAALAAAGITNFRFHDLRHTAATYLARNGATEQQLRAIGGWKSNIVNRYVHLAAEDVKAALGQLAEKIAS